MRCQFHTCNDKRLCRSAAYSLKVATSRKRRGRRNARGVIDLCAGQKTRGRKFRREDAVEDEKPTARRNLARRQPPRGPYNGLKIPRLSSRAESLFPSAPSPTLERSSCLRLCEHFSGLSLSFSRLLLPLAWPTATAVPLPPLPPPPPPPPSYGLRLTTP